MKVMWRASSWRLLCCWLAAFMHEIIILYDCHVQEKKTKNQIMLPANAGWMDLFPVKASQGCSQCAHLHYDWWWKMEEALHFHHGRWYIALVLWLCEREELCQDLRGERSRKLPLHAVWKWPQKSIFSASRWTFDECWTFRIHHFWKIFSLTSSLTVYIDVVCDSIYSYHKVNFKHYDHVF